MHQGRVSFRSSVRTTPDRAADLSTYNEREVVRLPQALKLPCEWGRCVCRSVSWTTRVPGTALHLRRSPARQPVGSSLRVTAVATSAGPY